MNQQEGAAEFGDLLLLVI